MNIQTAFATQDWVAEEWRPIQGFPGYEVSNYGRARSFRHKCGRRKKPRVAVLHKDKRWGYWHFGPRREDCTRVNLLIHIVVAETFIGPRPPQYEVNHKDGNKANNDMRNLEYLSSSDNQKHAIKLGLHLVQRGSDHPCAKLTEDQVREIRNLRAQGHLLEELAEKFGIRFQAVSSICRRQTWKHIA
jgi:hypothetical protein